MKGLAPVFGTFTYPSTVSNEGASTFITIGDISAQADTMSFTISSSLLADGFPDTSLHIGLVYDFDNDGIQEIVGGQNSIWITQESDISIRNDFYQPIGAVYDWSVVNIEQVLHLAINEVSDGSNTKILFFQWQADEQTFQWVQDTIIASNNVLVMSD